MDRYLVTEQSGLRSFGLGILLSVVCGILIQWATDPAKIRPLLEKELAKHNFTFESVRFQLSSGIFPELAFYVTNLSGPLSIQRENDATVRMDEVRVPIPFSLLYQQRLELNRFEVGDVRVERKKMPVDFSPPAASRKDARVRETVKANNSPIRSLAPYIGQWVGDVSIQYLHYIDQMSDMVFDFYRLRGESSEERIQIRGIINFTNESMVTSYTPQASFDVWANKTDLHGNLSGQWREGQFNAAAHANLADQKFDSQLKIDHLPFSEFLPFFKKVGLLSHDYNFSNTWLNLRAATVGAVDISTMGPVRVANAEIFGDLGSISARDVEFESINPLTYSPLKLTVGALKLSSFLKSLNVTSFPAFIGEVGTTSGVMSYTSPEKFRFDVDHSGLEFLFSNRGERATQTVSQASGHILYDSGKWNATLDHIHLVDGVFAGDVAVVADRDAACATVHIDELVLASSVQKLMTRDGSLGRWNGNIEVSLGRSGQVIDSKLDLSASDLTIEKLSVKHARVHGQSVTLHPGDAKTNLDVVGGELTVDKTSPVYPVISPIVGDSLAFRSLDGHITTDTLGNFQWRISSLLSESEKISSSGSWNEAGTLAGQASSQTLRKQKANDTAKKTFLLSGTRAEPTWTEK